MNNTQQQEAITVFLKHCYRKKFKGKSTILCTGEIAGELFFVVKGSITAVSENSEGKEIILAYLHEGDFFGEIGYFQSDHKRSAQIRAKTDCEIAGINYQHFQSLTAIFPQLILIIAEQLSRRLAKTSDKVFDLAFTNIQGRVAKALLNLCKEPGAITHPDGMQIKVTRQELGRIVGCSREMAGRVLKNLANDHLISVSGKTIVVLGTR